MRQILFEVPGLGVKIFGYGLMLFFAFLGSMNLAAWRARREKIDPEIVYDLALYVFLGGLRSFPLLEAFAGLAVYAWRANRLFELPILSILGVVSAYLLGILVRTMVNWWNRGRRSRSVRGWEDLKAAVVLTVMIYTAAVYLLDKPELAPPKLRHAALGLALFYFGSR